MVARWVDIVLVGWLAAVVIAVLDNTFGALLAVAIMVGFEIGCLLRWGHTPGKRLLGLTLVAQHDPRLPDWAAVLRPVVLFGTFLVPWAYWVPVWAVVLVVWMALAPQGRALPDLVVGTVVVDHAEV